METSPFNRRLRRAAASIALLCWLGPAAAQSDPPVPRDLEEVAIADRLDQPVPLDLEFIDENGNPVVLGQYFERGKPVLLTLVYFRCPMLCTLVLDGMIDALRPLDWVPGDQFEIVTVSIDPTEKPQLARFKKQSYVSSYGKPEAAGGWHFLTGRPEAIRALADSVGFSYKKIEETNEFAHPAALFLITPDGRVSRYLSGVQHEPKTVRLSLVEASEGKIGTTLDKFLLYCYRYDAEEGRYAPVAWRIMRLGGVLAVLVLGALLLSFWLKEARQKRLAQ
jgi:protein SCO1/2